MILFGLARRTARQIEKVSLFYEVEGAAAALRALHDEKVREAAAVQPEVRLRARGPLVRQRLATAAHDHVEGGRRHPLEACRIDQHVEVMLFAADDRPARIDQGDAVGGAVDEVDVVAVLFAATV